MKVDRRRIASDCVKASEGFSLAYFDTDNYTVYQRLYYCPKTREKLLETKRLFAEGIENGRILPFVSLR